MIFGKYTKNLETQGHVSDGREAGYGDEADLVIAVVVRMAAAGIDGAIDPAALRDAGVEQVAQVHTEIDLPDAVSLGDLERIAQ